MIISYIVFNDLILFAVVRNNHIIIITVISVFHYVKKSRF